MSVKDNRILIFGAGVIGCIYAVRFIEAGLNVTVLARSNRLKALRENGLQYNEKGTIKRVKVRVIEKLEQDDIYDYIFVPVRYDQAEDALLELKDNKSKNIVTMTNNSKGYSSWLEIIGDRLLPAFPSAGGEIRDGILYAQFGPQFIQATTSGEINGQVTERVKTLCEIFKAAKLPCSISKDIKAFQITHAAFVVAMLKCLYTDDGIMDQTAAASRETAHKVTVTIKEYMRALEKAGIAITPSKLKIILKCPDRLMDFVIRKLLGTKLVGDILFGGHASVVRNETLLLDRDYIDFLRENKVSIKTP